MKKLMCVCLLCVFCFGCSATVDNKKQSQESVSGKIRYVEFGNINRYDRQTVVIMFEDGRLVRLSGKMGNVIEIDLSKKDRKYTFFYDHYGDITDIEYFDEGSKNEN